MDLIDDLGNDLALAFLVEKKHRQKIDAKDVLALIRRVKAVLYRVSSSDISSSESLEIEAAARRMSH